MSKQNFLRRIMLLCTLLLLPVPAFATSMLSIANTGGGSFVLQGSLQNISGLQLQITYDSATLSNPRVTMGGLTTGMMSTVNPTYPIRLAAAGTKAITGNGVIATINFDVVGTAAGFVTVSGYGIDVSNNKVALASSYQPSTDNSASASNNETATTTGGGNGTTPTTTGADTGTTTTTTGTGTGTTAGYYQPVVAGGTVTMPSSDTSGVENKDRTAPAAQPTRQDPIERQVVAQETQAPAPDAKEEVHAPPPAPAPKVAPPPAPTPKPVQSVLEKFRLFQGEKTADSLTALFNGKNETCSQYPAIGIADGKTPVRLTISRVTGDQEPRFTFHSARYVSLAQVGTGAWEVEVIPEKGAVKASVNMLCNGTVQEFPLTVAPRVDVQLTNPGQLSEADFAAFLKGQGTASKHDPNRNGKRDYVDEYIFTANYLVKMEEQANKKKADPAK